MDTDLAYALELADAADALTLPRFRWDQLMRLGWLFFFEIALVNIFVVAGILAFIR